MCLSTAYINNLNDDSIVMKNVMKIELENEYIILTDLMERKHRIKGRLIKADLMENFVLIKEEV